MFFVFILSILVGVATVVQAGLNKVISEKNGLAFTLHVGNLVVLFSGLIILSLIPVLTHGDFGQMLKWKFEPKYFSWWYLLPGVCGLIVVTGIPYAIYKVGAAKIFVAVIGAQVIGSLVWDKVVEGTPIDTWRIVGGVLTCLGALALSFSG